jgi:uncharacterized RDD family membrane protein YckC
VSGSGREDGDDLEELGRRMGLSSGDPLWSGEDPARRQERERDRERDAAPPVPAGWLPPTDAPPPPPEALTPARDVGGGFAPPVDTPPPTAGPGGARVVPVAGRVAEYWPRVGAAVVDFFVRLALVLAGLLVGALGYTGGEASGETGTTIGLILGAAAGVAYAPIMMARTGGQTVGHRSTNTRVVRRDGSRITGGGAAAREILVKAILIEGIGGFLFAIPTILNYLWPLWDADNEALHDKICSTRVVEA